MKEIFLKIIKGVFYSLGVFFIIVVISTIFEGGNILIGIISIIFAVLIFPAVFSKFKENLFNNLKVSHLKYNTIYILVVFLGYMLSLGVMSGGLAEKQETEKQRIESITKFDVNYLKLELIP